MKTCPRCNSQILIKEPIYCYQHQCSDNKNCYFRINYSTGETSFLIENYYIRIINNTNETLIHSVSVNDTYMALTYEVNLTLNFKLPINITIEKLKKYLILI